MVDKPSNPRNIWIILLVVMAGLALFLTLRDTLGTLDFDGPLTDPALYRNLLVLAFVAATLIWTWRGRRSDIIKYGAIWVMIGLAVLIVYSFRDDLGHVASRVQGELLPHHPVAVGALEVRIRADRSGHFLTQAQMGPHTALFLVDTGATTVALTRATAQAMGFDIPDEAFFLPIQTANGKSFAAQARLKELSIGPITQKDVPAIVLQDRTGPNLLGLSFLNRLSSYEIRGDLLYMRQ